MSLIIFSEIELCPFYGYLNVELDIEYTQYLWTCNKVIFIESIECFTNTCIYYIFMRTECIAPNRYNMLYFHYSYKLLFLYFQGV